MWQLISSEVYSQQESQTNSVRPKKTNVLFPETRAPAAQRQMRQMPKKISFGPTFFHLAHTFFADIFIFFFVISGMNCASG